jgi:folate-dependent phosphoribosylglycinamide formyltransferase PurN
LDELVESVLEDDEVFVDVDVEDVEEDEVELLVLDGFVDVLTTLILNVYTDP